MTTMTVERIEEMRVEIKGATTNLWIASVVRERWHAELDALCDLSASALRTEGILAREAATLIASLSTLEAATVERCIAACHQVATSWPGTMSEDARRALADVISRCVDAIRALSSAQEAWVPVIERLPGIDDYVMWWGEGCGHFIEARDKDGDDWLAPKDQFAPTHWQPLPAAPTAPSAASGEGK